LNDYAASFWGMITTKTYTK